MTQVYAIVRLETDTWIREFKILQVSEDVKKLRRKKKEYEQDLLSLTKRKKLANELHDKMMNDCRVAKKVSKRLKNSKIEVPNRTDKNQAEWLKLIKFNAKKEEEFEQKFKQNFINKKVPEELKIFFLDDHNFENLWCTSFAIVEVNDNPYLNLPICV